MEPKKENEPATALAVAYEPLPAEYKPHNPTEKQKRSLERAIRKKRNRRA